MSDPAGPDDAVDNRLLDEADFLIRRHRAEGPDLRAPEPVATPAPVDRIPTLTDLVAPGRVGVDPQAPMDRSSPAALPTRPRAALSESALAAAVLERLEQRFERDLDSLIEQRILPELAGSIDYALSVIKRDLEQALRAWIREAVEQARHDGDGTASPDGRDASGESPIETRPL
ncbi:MAG: hypothetical protein U1F52_20035 [Burkholderiales bacterium]